MDFGGTAQVAGEVVWEEQVGNSTVVREPIGVVGAITPWNYPLHQLCAKVAPALAAGCSVVAKPSEVTPLSAFVLAEIIDEAGLPAGVFNLVTGFGPVVGEAIAAHDGVDMVSFTGSTRAGKMVSRGCGRQRQAGLARARRQVGQRDPRRRRPEARLSHGVANCLLNSGQTCSAHTRMLVPRSKLEEAEGIAAATAEKMAPGDPFEPTARIGPLVSDAQRDARARVHRQGRGGGREARRRRRRAARRARDRLLRAAHRLLRRQAGDDDRPGGDLRPGAVDHALRRRGRGGRDRQRHRYGLDGGVWSADPERAKAFARRMRTGQVQINGATFNPLAPFGGYKQSGHGRELGKFGLEEFLETKSIQS